MNPEKPRSLPNTGIILLILGLCALIPVAKMAMFAYTPMHSGSKETLFLQVRKGFPANEITKELISKKIISDAKYFTWFGKLTRQWGKIKVGEYQLSAAMTPAEIFSTLVSGISVFFPVTVREGENLYEISADLHKKTLTPSADSLTQISKDPAFISSISFFKTFRPATLEGYLFPDTYFFNHALTKQEMAIQMVRHFFDFWGPQQLKRAEELGMSLHTVVILASMIEKETGATQERPLISSVFHNRLKKKMRLQSDPTTIYGMWERYHGSIQKSDLSEKNLYNTYQIPGLPIGPISNPGKESLTAALYPAKTDYLYFVSHNDGTHEFTTNYEDHLAAVRKFQLDPQAHIGKSWRNLARKQAAGAHPSHSQ